MSTKIGVLIAFGKETDIRARFQGVKDLDLQTCQVNIWDTSLYTDENAEKIVNASKETGVEISTFWAGWRGPQSWNFYEGQYDLGHKPGHEHWREAEKAEKEGLTQEQFNERMNNPDYYQIEDPHENRSHAHEQPKEEKENSKSQVDEYGVDLSKAEKSNYQGQENSKHK